MQLGNGIESTELMLEVEIPFQQRARRERERESRLLEDAALARMDATLRAVEERGASAWARWTSARERRQLIENTLLPQIGRAHVCTPVTNAHHVCRPLLEKKKHS